MQKCQLPSFFRTKTMGMAQGLSFGSLTFHELVLLQQVIITGQYLVNVEATVLLELHPSE